MPLLLVVGFLGWLLAQLNKDPVRSGPAQVTGGVSDDTVRAELQRRGTERNLALIPGSIARGRGYGWMMVSYRGGAVRLRRFNGEIVYRARGRYLNGWEDDIYMLQGCGNDVTYGGTFYRVLNKFRFEVEAEGVGEPVVVPTIEPVVVTAPEPIAPAETAVAMVTDGVPEVAVADADEFLLKYTAARTPGGTHCIELGANPPSGFSLSLGTTGSAVIKWRSKAK